MAIEYEDFLLEIEEIEDMKDRFRATLRDGGPQDSHEFELPFNEYQLENFFLKLGSPRRQVVRSTPGYRDLVKTFGRKLFERVFDGEISNRLEIRYRAAQAAKSEKGLRIRLLIHPPGLLLLPWEYLFNPKWGRHLTPDKRTPVVRSLETPGWQQPQSVDGPLKVLVAIAGPKDVLALDAETEWKKLQAAVVPLEKDGRLVLKRLEPRATLANLRSELRKSAYHVFHFIGHGVFDTRDQKGKLIFEDDDGYHHEVEADFIASHLREHRSLRLCVLNACEGARASLEDPFSGIAQRLLHQELPAIIAMQFEITDLAAKTFSEEFYKALADNAPIEAALSDARKAIQALSNTNTEWGNPVLYMAAAQGRLFKVRHDPRAVSSSNPAPNPELNTPPEERPVVTEDAPMVLIKSGHFLMGNPNRKKDEKPRHKVSVRSFHMDETPVTVAEYKIFLDEKTSHRKPWHWEDQLKSPNRPVVFVSWHDAKAYAAWKGKRLPTEAEWEYAARKPRGDNPKASATYPSGPEITSKQANFDAEKKRWVLLSWHRAKQELMHARSYAPNQNGLYGMAGNMWEWCSDWYGKYPGEGNPLANPKGPESGKHRVIRGGCWASMKRNLRVTCRRKAQPRLRASTIGFRCVRDIDD